MFIIIEILSFINSSIRPCKIPLPAHFIPFPASFINPAIKPRINSFKKFKKKLFTFSFNVVIFEPSFITTPIAPFKMPMAVFHAVFIIPFINTAILPNFFTIPVLFILFPVSNIPKKTSIKSKNSYTVPSL